MMRLVSNRENVEPLGRVHDAMLAIDPELIEAAAAVFNFRIERFNKPTIVPGTDTWGTRPVILTIDNASGLIVRETPEYGDLP